MDKPENPLAFNIDREEREPQEYYARIKEKFAQERAVRLEYRPEGTAQFTSEFSGALEKYAIDPNVAEATPRAPLDDTVECLFIGGGFSALLTSVRLRQVGVAELDPEIDVVGGQDLIGDGQIPDPGRDVHAVTEQIVVLDDQ